MVSPNLIGDDEPLGQLVLNVDIFRGEFTEEQEDEFLNAVANALERLSQAVTEETRTPQIEILRSGRIWGGNRTAALPLGGLWVIRVSIPGKENSLLSS